MADRLDVRLLRARDCRQPGRHPERDLPLRVPELVAVDEPLRRHDHVALAQEARVAAQVERDEARRDRGAQLLELGRLLVRDDDQLGVAQRGEGVAREEERLRLPRHPGPDEPERPAGPAAPHRPEERRVDVVRDPARAVGELPDDAQKVARVGDDPVGEPRHRLRLALLLLGRPRVGDVVLAPDLVVVHVRVEDDPRPRRLRPLGHGSVTVTHGLDEDDDVVAAIGPVELVAEAAVVGVDPARDVRHAHRHGRRQAAEGRALRVERRRRHPADAPRGAA